jgi:CheY-like chemotaxis protein
MHHPLSPFEILMAEDSPTDQAIAQTAFKSAKVPNRLHTVTNGYEALAFLGREGPHAAAPAPDLILLDLNMPRKNGLETLVAIKQHPELKHIPIIILTSSSAERDVVAAYGHHANGYIVKPVDFEQFVRVAESLMNFWSNVVKLPPKTA